jgi:anti-anti-sigma factor
MQNLKSILIVDDEIDILSQLNTFLRQEGYNVFAASNGIEGLSVFKNQRPNICIFDYKMPGKDGLQLLREVKEIDPKTEILLISGHADMKVAVQAIKEHAFDFLPKPIDLDELLEKLRQVSEKMEYKKKLDGEWAGGILLNKNLDTSIPISELTMTMDMDEIGAPRFVKELDHLLTSGSLKKNIIISLGKVQRINNIGLNVLVEMYTRSTQNGHKVALSNLTGAVSHYLHMLGYDTYFPIIKSSEHPEDVFLKI